MSAATLIDRLARRAEEDAGREALAFDDTTLTFGELWEQAGRCATALGRLGLERGDRLVTVLPNGTDFFAVFVGAQRAGLVPVPVFPGSGLDRILSVGARCGARVAIVSKRSGLSAVAQTVEVDRLLESAGSVAPPPPRGDEVAYIQYTSGSTGEPKGVQITHAALRANIEQLIAGLRITNRDVFVSWLPVYHDMGLVLMSLVPFFLAARLVLLTATLRSLVPWLEAVERYRGTLTAAPDFAYRLCLRQVRDRSRFDLSSLRVALNAAEPVRSSTVREFEDSFGLRRVMLPAYGLAEATVGVGAGEPGGTVRVDDKGFVSVGRPFPGIEVAVVLDDRPAGVGEVGEIVVRSPANTCGYFGDPEATAALRWREGFLRTGDLGYLDARGELFVVGRSKNLIIQAGRNIAPGEIEEVVDALDFVRYSAAVGIDRGGVEGEQVYVFAEARAAGADEDESRHRVAEIVRRIHAHLGLRPGRVYLTRRAIPRTHNGKIRHGELKRRYVEGELRTGGRLVYPDY